MAAVAAAVLATASAAAAGEARKEAAKPVVYECDSKEAKRLVKREYGRVQFATSGEVMAVVRGQRAAFDGPRCMTQLESWRLDRALAELRNGRSAERKLAGL
jgi:hypothetical protein